MFSFAKNAAPDLALDLGTRNFLISNGQGILHREQSVGASRRDRPASLITGSVANELFERDPGHFEIIRPLSKGVICDFKNCAEIVARALSSSFRRWRKPKLLMTAPLDITSVERAAFEEVGTLAGASSVVLISEPVAAGVGLIKGFADQAGALIVDVGAGITEVALFSQGGIVSNASVRLGGEDFENTIMQHLRQRYQLQVGRKTSLELIETLCHRRNEMFLQPITIRGFDLNVGLPSSVAIEALELDSCLDAHFHQVTDCIHSVLDSAPPELSAPILENGLHLTGGASQFPRLHEIIEERLGVRVNLDLQPLLGVARGEIRLMQDPKLLKYLSERACA